MQKSCPLRSLIILVSVNTLRATANVFELYSIFFVKVLRNLNKRRLCSTGDVDRRIPISGISDCDDCHYLYNEDYQRSICSAEHTWTKGSITLDIPWSLVTSVTLTMSGGPGTLMHFDSTSPVVHLESYGDFYLVSLLFPPGEIEVSVCVRGENCSSCGSIVGESYEMIHIGISPREIIQCSSTNGVEGNQVVLTQKHNRNDFAQPCEIEIYGKGWFSRS